MASGAENEARMAARQWLQSATAQRRSGGDRQVSSLTAAIPRGVARWKRADRSVAARNRVRRWQRQESRSCLRLSSGGNRVQHGRAVEKRSRRGVLEPKRVAAVTASAVAVAHSVTSHHPTNMASTGSKTPVKKRLVSLSVDDPLLASPAPAPISAAANTDPEPANPSLAPVTAAAIVASSDPIPSSGSAAPPAVPASAPIAAATTAAPASVPESTIDGKPTIAAVASSPEPAVAAALPEVVDWRQLLVNERGKLPGEKLMMNLLYSTFFNLLTGTATPGQFCMTSYQVQSLLRLICRALN